jgi:hypothetical protein
MTSFILIDHECSITQQKARIKRETLYKKCGLKTANDFGPRHTWLVETFNIHSIELWAHCVGTIADENKLTLPAPLTPKTYYGTMVIIALNKKGDIISMNIEKWKKIYEQLMNDIESDEIQSDEDDDDDAFFSAKEKTFVDDDSCEDADENDNETENDNHDVSQNHAGSDFDEDELLTQVHCGAELEEELYDYSDTA